MEGPGGGAGTSSRPEEACGLTLNPKVGLFVVLINDVRFVNVVVDIATRITGEEISVSNKHLDQNERLDDFGSRTRPQFFYLTII